MKQEPLSGASVFPRRRRGRTLVEPLEARLLYSADASTVTAVRVSPLLCGTGIAQAALVGGLPNRQVEVATVQATGVVGPSVRIDVAQLAELRADAAPRREDLFQKAAERSSLLWSASDEWSTGSQGVGRSGQPGQSTNPGGDESEAEALARFHSAPATSRIEAQATLVAQAWKRLQETPSSDSDTDGDLDSYEVTGPIGVGGTMTPMWQAPLTIAVIDHGDILLLPEPRDFDYGSGSDGSGGGIFGSVTTVSLGLSSGSAATEPHLPTRFRLVRHGFVRRDEHDLGRHSVVLFRRQHRRQRRSAACRRRPRPGVWSCRKVSIARLPRGRRRRLRGGSIRRRPRRRAPRAPARGRTARSSVAMAMRA